MIVLLGIAGSGKSTQAELLANRLNCRRLSSGDVLRANADKPQIKAALESGVLVPDEILLPLIEVEFKKIGADKNELILDGVPRNVAQAKWLVDKIKSGELPLTAIVHLKISKDAVIERLQKRGRHDDSQEAIEGRFKFYEESVLPAINYFQTQVLKVYEVDAAKSPEQVAAEIEAVLKNAK